MELTNEHSLPPASTSRMILFAFPRIGSSLLLGVVGFALLTLYTTGYGLNGDVVAFIISGGYIAIALSQFFFGWISDVSYTKKLGGRKPFVLLLTPLLAVSFIFLLMPSLFLKNPSDKLLLGWLAIWNTLFEISYAVTTPYQAWMAEQFRSEDRPKCSQIQNICNFIGQAAQTLFSMIVLTKFAVNFESNPEVIPPGFLWICIIFAVIFTASFYTSTLLMPTEAPPTSKPNLRENFRNIFQNRNYLLVVFMQGLASIAWVILSTVMLKFLTDVLFLNTTQYIIMAGSLIIGMVVFLVVWKHFIGKLGKKQSILYVFISGVIFCPISLFGLIDMQNPLLFAVIFILGVACVLGGWYLFPYIIYADLAEDDCRTTKTMKAGTYVGFPSIVLNLFQAAGTAILGLILKLPDITVGSKIFSLGMVVWGPVCALVLLGVIFYTKSFVKLDFEWEHCEDPNLE